MTPRLSRNLAILLAAAALTLGAAAQTSVAPPPLPVDASTAIPKDGNKVFFEKHESFLARAKAGPIGLLFVGDSIT